MIDRNKLIKGLLIITGIFVLVCTLTQISRKNSMTLEDYAKQNPEIAYMEKPEATPTPTPNLQQATSTLNDDLTGKISTDTEATQTTVSLPNSSSESQESTLIGATLNGDAVIDQRTTYEDGFYYEPLSENLQRYITGVSFPSTTQTEDEKNTNSSTDLGISYDDLSYVHVLHYDFAGNLAEGELICNRAIAQDFVEIFYELYQNEYQIEKMHLIDEYDGDDTASMDDNNTSCFNYRVVAGSTSLSKHALGLAIDINPLYNPYITYEKDETGQITKENVSPVSATAYADREISFPYKIDENDLCYKLFVEHGFTWGGNWNSCKDYQHFQKTVK